MLSSKVKFLQRLLQLRHTFCCSPTFGKTFCSRLVLGIETSCDDTGAAVLDERGAILGESLHSQKEVHLRWVCELHSFITALPRDLFLTYELLCQILQNWWHHPHSGTAPPQRKHRACCPGGFGEKWCGAQPALSRGHHGEAGLGPELGYRSSV